MKRALVWILEHLEHLEPATGLRFSCARAYPKPSTPDGERPLP